MSTCINPSISKDPSMFCHTKDCRLVTSTRLLCWTPRYNFSQEIQRLLPNQISPLPARTKRQGNGGSRDLIRFYTGLRLDGVLDYLNISGNPQLADYGIINVVRSVPEIHTIEELVTFDPSKKETLIIRVSGTTICLLVTYHCINDNVE